MNIRVNGCLSNGLHPECNTTSQENTFLIVFKEQMKASEAKDGAFYERSKQLKPCFHCSGAGFSGFKQSVWSGSHE